MSFYGSQLLPIGGAAAAPVASSRAAVPLGLLLLSVQLLLHEPLLPCSAHASELCGKLLVCQDACPLLLLKSVALVQILVPSASST